jgi:N-acetylmuramoyl-L-alanine amidase
MHRHTQREYLEPIRAFYESDWEDHVLFRWTAQICAGALPGIAIVLILMQMAQRSPQTGQSNSAALVPLLSAGAISDTAAFHRMSQPVMNSAVVVQMRQPRAPTVVAKRPAAPAVAAVKIDFQQPRTAWHYLGASARTVIDTGLVQAAPSLTVVLHGSASTSPRLGQWQRYTRQVHGDQARYDFVVGASGQVQATEAWHQTPSREFIAVCLAGDFDRSPPSADQLQALDELLDYLRVKRSDVRVSTHAQISDKANCLGSRFPEGLVSALNRL